MYRVYDVDRYDDRDLIQTNLIESYDRLMSFIIKHLDDRFFLENDRRIDIRNIIGREICVNLLIHREFVEPFYSRLIIEKDFVKTENANRARMIGDIIKEKDFSPKPKNPKIAMVFREIGLADELGSGMKKLVKYTKAYSGGVPKLIEGDVFRTEIPLNRISSNGNGLNEHVNEHVNLLENEKVILEYLVLNPNASQKEIAKETSMTFITVRRLMDNLKDKGYIKRQGADKNGYWKILK